MIKWLQGMAVVLSLATAMVQAAVTGIVPVQGQLEDSTGLPLDGSIDITFTLYRDAEGSQPVWTDTMSIAFELGTFTARLGSSAPLELALFRDEQTLHLGIRVDGDDEMQPIPLGTVPWAAYAHHANDAAQVGGLSLTGIEALIPATSDIEALARAVSYDSEAELTDVLDPHYSYTVGHGLLRAGTQIDLDTARVPVADSYRSLVRVQSKGNASTLGNASVYINQQLVQLTGRSYGLVVVDRATGSVVSARTYDVYDNALANDELAAELALFSADHIIIINTFDEPNANRLGDGLAEQIYRCGGTPEVFGGAGFADRAAYVLVGICDMGPGTGIELYSGDVASDTTAFLDYSFELVDGQLLR